MRLLCGYGFNIPGLEILLLLYKNINKGGLKQDKGIEFLYKPCLYCLYPKWGVSKLISTIHPEAFRKKSNSGLRGPTSIRYNCVLFVSFSIFSITFIPYFFFLVFFFINENRLKFISYICP